jgi:Protein of unknown function (DUF2568)
VRSPLALARPAAHAPGRNRTFDLALRRRALYPLSYGRGDRGSVVDPLAASAILPGVAAVLYTVRFLLELALVAAFAAWGWDVAGGGIGGAVLAGVVAAGVAGVWGALVAPRARRRLADRKRLALELALFALGAGALWAAWALLPAVVLFFGSTVVAFTTRRVADPFAHLAAK